jgi:hypothetical protein
MAWSGILIAATGIGPAGDDYDSGWIQWPQVDRPPDRVLLRSEIPEGVGGAQTMTIVLYGAQTADGDGQFTIHNFTTVDVNKTPENVIIPGEDSEGELFQVVGSDGGVLTAPLPPWIKVTAVKSTGGSSGVLNIYAAMV